MEPKTFWNEVARWGAIVGVLLAASFVVENLLTASGRIGLYFLLLLEEIVVVVLHFWLLLRFVRNRSVLYGADEGFTFGQGYGCVMAVSLFAGVIVGVVQAVYLHLIVGYPNYIEQTIAALNQMLTHSGSQLPASFEGVFAQMFEKLREAPVPSVLQTVWGGLFSSLFFGAFFGLIVAAVAARAPRPFDEPRDGEEPDNGEAND